MSYKHMQTMCQKRGGNIRQSMINDGRDIFNREFADDPSYQDSYVIWKFGVEENRLSPLPIRTFHEKFSDAHGMTLNFSTKIADKITIGTVLLNKKTGFYYLCIESYNRDEIIADGKLARCNAWLKWQDENGNVFEYPVVDINATQYNSGEQANKTMYYGSSQHRLSISADENTIPIDHDMRFFLDRNKKKPTVYKVTQNDTTDMFYEDGILYVFAVEDQYNIETDSIENWLCDYKPEQVVGTIDISYFNKPTIRMGGSSKTFTAESEDIVTWSNDLTEEQAEYITISIEDNTCTIKCGMNENLINTVFTLTCTDSNDNTGFVEITIIGG